MWSPSEFEDALEVLLRLEARFRLLLKAMKETEVDKVERALRRAHSKIYHRMDIEEIYRLIEEISDMLDGFLRRN